jgi:hypothetical protein
MHRTPETMTTAIETALVTAKYEGNAFVAYLLEMALIAASEHPKINGNASHSLIGLDQLRAVA